MTESTLWCEDPETGKAVLKLLKKKQPARERVAQDEEICDEEE
jgi:hypothetical protein